MFWPKKDSALAAAWFATALCLLMLVGSVIQPTATSPAFPAFFSFLPVVFFIIAREHERAEKKIRELGERIGALEASAKARKEPSPAA
jgi:hypothetical protein